MKLEGDGYVGGPVAGRDDVMEDQSIRGDAAEWDAENLKRSKPVKAATKQVRVVIDGVAATIDKTGTCNKCGEPIMHASNLGMWLHRGRVSGKRYAHQARPKRRVVSADE